MARSSFRLNLPIRISETKHTYDFLRYLESLYDENKLPEEFVKPKFLHFLDSPNYTINARHFIRFQEVDKCEPSYNVSFNYYSYLKEGTAPLAIKEDVVKKLSQTLMGGF